MLTAFYFFYTFGITVSLVWLVKLLKHYQLSKKLPPGPTGYPILGVLPWLYPPSTIYKTLTGWADTHGAVFSFSVGTKPHVVLSSFDAVKDSIVKNADAFAARPDLRMGDFTHQGFGLINSNGQLWKEQRRFALTTLRDLGLGKPIMENKIREETDILIEEIAKSKGEPADYQLLMNNAVSNIICALVFGKRFDYDDVKFLKLMDDLSYMITRSGENAFSLINLLPPWASSRSMMPQATKKTIEKRGNVFAFCQDIIEEHKDSFSSENEPEDYIHAFMAAGSMTKGPSNYTEIQLMESVIGLFLAGTETTSTTLRWAMLLLAQHPEVQDRVRKEISDIVGAGNIPDLRNRPKLPYTEATIYEVQRIANLVPLVRRKALYDTTVDGYTIPKGTSVTINLWAIHRDPTCFTDPDLFNPDRFIQDGKVVKNEAVIPFSVGKRACLGESLAKMELFMFFTALFQKFKFEVPDDLGEGRKNNYEKDRLVGVTSSPKNFLIRALPTKF